MCGKLIFFDTDPIVSLVLSLSVVVQVYFDLLLCRKKMNSIVISFGTFNSNNGDMRNFMCKQIVCVKYFLWPIFMCLCDIVDNGQYICMRHQGSW